MTNSIEDKLKHLADSGTSLGVPLYERIRKNLETMILSSELPDNYRLPADKDLASFVGVNHITLVKSLNLLRKQGLIVRNRARGTFVKAAVKNQSVPGEKKRLTAVIFDDVNPQTFQSELFISLHENLHENGLEILFLSSAGDKNVQFKQIQKILQRPNCCACLVWSILEPQQAEKLINIKPVDFPLIFMDTLYDEFGHDCSIYDNSNAARNIGKYIINQNYKKVLFFIREKKFKNNSLSTRYFGLRKAFAEKNIPPENVILYKFDENRSLKLDEIISQARDAMVVCATAESAIMLENHLNQNGYQVPDTFPLISFGPAFGPVSLKQKNISEMRFSPANLGKNTVNILMERLNGNRSAWKCARSNALFFERASSKILPASRLKSAPVLT